MDVLKICLFEILLERDFKIINKNIEKKNGINRFFPKYKIKTTIENDINKL
tara:strand:- start:977 stop:1129 length:153 start_codon:yes stop_codon:yes gene_type:complete